MNSHFLYKILLLAGTQLICSLASTEAQVRIGICAGATASFVNQDQNTGQTDGNDARPGFNGGIKIDIPLLKKPEAFSISLAPEIFFIQNGADNQYYTSPGDLTDSIGKINLNYIGLYVPIKLKYQKEPGSTGFYLLAGGYFDNIAGSSLSNDGSSQSLVFNGGGDKTDFGFRGDLGIAIPTNKNNLAVTVEIGYSKGLQNIQFYTVANPMSDGTPYTINNSGLIVTLGVRF